VFDLVVRKGLQQMMVSTQWDSLAISIHNSSKLSEPEDDKPIIRQFTLLKEYLVFYERKRSCSAAIFSKVEAIKQCLCSIPVAMALRATTDERTVLLMSLLVCGVHSIFN
jgi:hypothetical protein